MYAPFVPPEALTYYPNLYSWILYVASDPTVFGGPASPAYRDPGGWIWQTFGVNRTRAFRGTQSNIHFTGYRDSPEILWNDPVGPDTPIIWQELTPQAYLDALLVGSPMTQNEKLGQILVESYQAAESQAYTPPAGWSYKPGYAISWGALIGITNFHFVRQSAAWSGYTILDSGLVRNYYDGTYQFRCEVESNTIALYGFETQSVLPRAPSMLPMLVPVAVLLLGVSAGVLPAITNSGRQQRT